MIEKGLPGGMTQCKYEKVSANSKYREEEYDKTKPSSYLTYWLCVRFAGFPVDPSFDERSF